MLNLLVARGAIACDQEVFTISFIEHNFNNMILKDG